MKKLVFVLGLGVFAACGGGAASDAAKDSTAKDSVVAPVVDTTKKDSTPVVVDTTKKDTTKKK